MDYLLLNLLQILDIQTVITVHDVLPFALGHDFTSAKGKIYRRLYAISSGLILNSKFAWDSLGQFDPTLLEKATVIPQGGYTALFQSHFLSPQVARAELGIGEQESVILVFGTIKPNKRLDLVIMALARLLTTHPQTQLIIAGKPRDRDVNDDIALARHLGVNNHIIWQLKQATDAEMIAYFCAADVIVFPYEWIYQSAALLMAMSFGKVVVATTVGSNCDVIRHEHNGMLVSPTDSEMMVAAIRKILNDPEGARLMGEAAQEYVSKELGWEKIAKATVDFYNRIINQENHDRRT